MCPVQNSATYSFHLKKSADLVKNAINEHFCGIQMIDAIDDDNSFKSLSCFNHF